MRTLKKVLALTVVLATLLSISSFAAFSDEESIDESFVDAVNLLGALNVMTGDTEGTFRPNDTIMRAEAAKMIYVIRNGGVDDQAAGWTGMSTFSDVPSGAWYEGYVNYCASLGIIAGVGNGLFNPNGAVTGVELAKMLLVVADYKPDIEGYTGAGWNLNVIRDAQTAGMFKGYTLAYSAAATRQQAAQLFSNAILETQIAVYIGDTRVNDLAAITNTDTIGGRFFGLFTRTGILTNVPHVTLPVDVATSPGNNNNTVVHYDTLTANGTSDLNANNSLAQISSFGNNAWDDALFEFEADPDLLYQEVDVIFREDTDDPGVLSRDSKVYAVLPTGNTYVYETTMDAITIELDDDSMDVDYDAGAAYNPVTIQFEGFNGGRAKVLPENYQLAVVTNLYEGKTLRISGMGTHTAEWDRDVYLVDKADVEFLATTSTAPVRLIDYDRDGDLDIAFVTTPYYGTVSSYNADRFEFTTDTVIDGDNITTGRREENFERFTFEDDVEKDDVIAVTIDVLSGEMLYNVALVEPTVGELTYVYSTGPDNEVVIGGETYGFYGLLFGGEYLADMDPVLEANAYHGDLGSEVTVYTDGKYIVSAYVEPATLGTGFAFVKNYNPQGNSFDLMPDDSKALLLELVLPNGDTVVKEYDREEVSSDSAAFYEDDELVQNGAATQTLKDMLGNIVEYSSDGDYVAFRKTHKTATNDADLAPMYYNDGVDVFEFNSTTGLFRVKNTNTAVDVNENSVFFLPTYKDGVTKDKLDRGDITKVAVINGNELRGMPTITTADTADTVMQLVSSLQAGVRTVAYAALDAGSTVSDTGVFAYALTNDWDKDDGEEDERQVRAVLSDSDSDEGAVINLDNEDILANKVYRATRNSDGTYTLDEITNGETVDGATMMLGSIRGRNGNNVTIEDAKSGSNVYSVTNDTVVFVVDIDARGSMTRINLGDVNDLSEAAEIKGAPNTYYNNVLFEYDANNELSVVYVEAVGMDVEPLINYRSVSSLTVEAPVLTAGMDRATAEAAVLAAVEKALPNHGGITYTNWKAAGVAFNWGTNVANGTEYSVDVTVQPTVGLTFEATVEVNKVDVTTAANGSITFTLKATAGAVVIDRSDVDGDPATDGVQPMALPEIKADSTLPDKVNGSISNATISDIVWDNAGNPTYGDKRVGKFTVKAAADCEFAEDFTLGLQGTNEVTVTETRKSDSEIEVTLSVTLGAAPVAEIPSLTITLSSIAAGGSLSGQNATAEPSTGLANRGIETATITDVNGGTVDAGDTLSVRITYTVSGNYAFADDVVVAFADPGAFTNVSATSFGTSLVVTAETVVAMAVDADTRVVDTEEELTAALADGDVENIIISGDITLANNTTYNIGKKVNISGESGASITCAYTAEGPDSGVFTFWPGSEGSVLSDLTINFTSAKRDSAAVFLTGTFGVADSTETTIEDVKFIGANELENVGQESAIITASSAQGTVSVKNCSITNFKYGMYFNNAKNLEVTGNTINGTLYNGIMVDTAVEGHDVKVNNNTLKNISYANYNDAFYSSGISFGKTVTTKECIDNNITMLNGKTGIYDQPVA